MWSSIGRSRAKWVKSPSIVKMPNPLRTAVAQIRKSVLEPWRPFPRHLLEKVTKAKLELVLSGVDVVLGR